MQQDEIWGSSCSWNHAVHWRSRRRKGQRGEESIPNLPRHCAWAKPSDRAGQQSSRAVLVRDGGSCLPKSPLLQSPAWHIPLPGTATLLSQLAVTSCCSQSSPVNIWQYLVKLRFINDFHPTSMQKGISHSCLDFSRAVCNLSVGSPGPHYGNSIR